MLFCKLEPRILYNILLLAVARREDYNALGHPVWNSMVATSFLGPDFAKGAFIFLIGEQVLGLPAPAFIFIICINL